MLKIDSKHVKLILTCLDALG